MRGPFVVVTRAASPDDPLGLALRRGGAELLWLPTTVILAPLDTGPLDDTIARIPDMDWLVFTSGHAVDAFTSRPAWAGSWPPPGSPRPRVAAIGARTARRLVDRGVSVDLVPASPGAVSLVAALVATEGGSLARRRVLWPRSEIAAPDLAEGLRAAGATVIDPPAYRTVAATPAELGAFRLALEEGRVDAVCFLSPSAAEGLVAALGAEALAGLRGRLLVASLGPTTSEALMRLGAPPDVEATPPSAEGLAGALLARLSSRQGAFR